MSTRGTLGVESVGFDGATIVWAVWILLLTGTAFAAPQSAETGDPTVEATDAQVNFAVESWDTATKRLKARLDMSWDNGNTVVALFDMDLN